MGVGGCKKGGFTHLYIVQSNKIKKNLGWLLFDSGICKTFRFMFEMWVFSGGRHVRGRMWSRVADTNLCRTQEIVNMIEYHFPETRRAN